MSTTQGPVSGLDESGAGNGIKITAPSQDNSWTQNAENIITWTTSTSAPPKVTILIANSDPAILRAPLAIASSVDVADGTFTYTKTSLRAADGYEVRFTNPRNNTQVYATSKKFTVNAPLEENATST
ncbi:hypothetical protein EIP91_006590 [Steccherinum ochraceum]|uniref:Yeast cell wall synthesis Kre9/Knh1-like N-terminal domain-containing protein n=1 Tax=Steccherinum ochraceum TaxID=92696 RepID=A0A4R0RG44_9APHY|nr:hypothetical protein EIP91_006590 [Steccherinum ochraceum]